MVCNKARSVAFQAAISPAFSRRDWLPSSFTRSLFSQIAEPCRIAGWEFAPNVWDVEPGQEFITNRRIPGVRSLAYSPGGEQLAIGTSAPTSFLWLIDRTTGDLISEQKRSHGLIFSVTYSPGRQKLASTSEDVTSKFWTLRNRSRLSILSRLKGETRVNPDDRSKEHEALKKSKKDGEFLGSQQTLTRRKRPRRLGRYHASGLLYPSTLQGWCEHQDFPEGSAFLASR